MKRPRDMLALYFAVLALAVSLAGLTFVVCSNLPRKPYADPDRWTHKDLCRELNARGLHYRHATDDFTNYFIDAAEPPDRDELRAANCSIAGINRQPAVRVTWYENPEKARMVAGANANEPRLAWRHYVFAGDQSRLDRIRAALP